MIAFLIVLNVFLLVTTLYWRSVAKEFESLFELSKQYNSDYTWVVGTKKDDEDYTINLARPKLNKDGSIAKKRGRPTKKESK